ncbi:hypothetical protein PsorP6_007931 [Peronosclerospora sorghi]|uniref:Uncharacterized protein n=1 Tax=Peronosclerospora sorghi TaxID=230839 RepID=A0ACC0WBD5_9STRA|nr:hypothetical protein PsorP6_007931 [Peronosclerospora sorghi]
MMLLPVLEHFAEFGWQPFVEPAETYEFFTVSGIFRRANVDTSLHAGHSGAQYLVQRNALLDVCLKCSLTHLIVSYIRAEKASTQAFAGVKTYVLNEPIAVQQWARRRLEAIEKDVHEIINEQQPRRRELPCAEAMEEYLRHLNGLHTVLIALTERLKEGSFQAAYSSKGVDAEGNILNETELIRLTYEGVQNLLQLLSRTQSVSYFCDCMLWLQENQVAAASDEYISFYREARALRVTYREQFEEIYGTKLSYVSGSKKPMLLIEHVMKSAGISVKDVGGSFPPTQLWQLLEILEVSSIQNDVAQYYGDEIDSEPIEGYFRVQVALLLYFCLDKAFLSVCKQHTQNSACIASKMRSLTDSFAAQLSVRDDMKLTLLALWLVENAVVVKTSDDDQVNAIYENAIRLLQQSSTMHFHQKYDLEPAVILHLLETLVHRGENLVAWKVWNTFGSELQVFPPVATDLVVVISLELDLWEHALSLIRSQKRPDLLDVFFNWLMKSPRLKELVQGVTLLPREEKIFHTNMMEHNVVNDEDVLRDENIKRVDFLVMYYILRHKYEQAWNVHHKHLAMIRAMSRGDTEIAMAALNQPSLRIRAALLSNMSAEPPAKSYEHQSRVWNDDRRRHHATKPAALENEEMKVVSDPDTVTSTVAKSSQERAEERQATSTADAFVAAPPDHSTHCQDLAGLDESVYFPGFFSSRQGSSLFSQSVGSGKRTSTPTDSLKMERTNAGDISIESVDSNPDSFPQLLTKSTSESQLHASKSSSMKPSSAFSTPLVSPLGGK